MIKFVTFKRRWLRIQGQLPNITLRGCWNRWQNGERTWKQTGRGFPYFFLNVENDQESRDTNKTLTSSASSNIKKKCLKPAGAVSEVHHRHPVSWQPTQPFSQNHHHVSECDSWKSSFIAYYSPNDCKTDPRLGGSPRVVSLVSVLFSLLLLQPQSLLHVNMMIWWRQMYWSLWFWSSFLSKCTWLCFIDWCSVDADVFPYSHRVVVLCVFCRLLLFSQRGSTVTPGHLFLMERSWWW